MKPRKLPLIVAILVGIITMLAAKFVFHIRRHSVRLGFAAMLLVLVLFARPWHKGATTDDEDDDEE